MDSSMLDEAYVVCLCKWGRHDCPGVDILQERVYTGFGNYDVVEIVIVCTCWCHEYS